jgi:predicted DNA-binding antitoxin AbrB/MazE fold protein
MHMTIEAIYEAGILKPLVPLPDLPEHTKVRISPPYTFSC